jgi:1-pyrroline-5-carboxylate dehydrogenase
MLAHRAVKAAEIAKFRALYARGVASWSNFDPSQMTAENPATPSNLVFGEWTPTEKQLTLPDPLNGQPFLKCPDTQLFEIEPFVHSLKSVPKTGLHNPLKNPERYLLLGDITHKAASELRKDDVAMHFAKLIQRVAPKSLTQALGEVKVTRLFLDNFGGDQPRFLARGFTTPGDHTGQQSTGYRWPFGAVALIAPFNFPLEIPVLQMMGALYMGNKPLVHVDKRVSIVIEEFVRLLHHCGLPLADVDLIHGNGGTVGEILAQAKPASTLFTGSKKVAEHLAKEHHGRVFLEDAGFDWKILGPDVSDFEYVAWQCDQDAYACSGQKCSAQSILFMHENWVNAGLEAELAKRASTRKLDDLTIGPVLSWTTQAMLDHAKKLLKIPGARVAFGGEPLEDHTIPSEYGAIQPTAVFVPLKEILKPGNFELATTEVFGPFQVITEYGPADVPHVLEACERMEAHLTAAVVSNDVQFVNHILANTVNGTTYAGIRGRTTGAPQNHWFGPAGDPRAAGIGTPEAIKLVWSTHREVIGDFGPTPKHGTGNGASHLKQS